jgi:hypothetical protein
VGNAEAYLYQQNISGTGGGSGTLPPHSVGSGSYLPNNIPTGNFQIFCGIYFPSGATDSISCDAEPVFVSASGTAAVNAVPAPAVSWLMLAGAPLLGLRWRRARSGSGINGDRKSAALKRV